MSEAGLETDAAAFGAGKGASEENARPTAGSSTREGTTRGRSSKRASLYIIQCNNVQVGPRNIIGTQPSPPVRRCPASVVERLRLLEDKLTKELILAILPDIGRDWRILGRHLGFTDGQLDQFNEDHKTAGLAEVVYQMLLDCIQNDPDLTVGSFSGKLRKANQHGALRKLAQQFHL